MINVPMPPLQVTQEDIDAGKLVGATGAQVLERVIHGHLDREGVPRNGRQVRVSPDGIEITLPGGYRFV